MIKSLEFVRPEDIPYMLLNFQFYFENENSHWINIYHAAGMQLVYHITKACYVFPQNCFYQLLQLHNKNEIHVPKYDWLLMKGAFEGIAKIKVGVVIENEDVFTTVHPEVQLEKTVLDLHRLPEEGNDIVIMDRKAERSIFYHFFCSSAPDLAESVYIHLFYLNTYDSIDRVLDLWFDENNVPRNVD